MSRERVLSSTPVAVPAVVLAVASAVVLLKSGFLSPILVSRFVIDIQMPPAFIDGLSERRLNGDCCGPTDR